MTLKFYSSTSNFVSFGSCFICKNHESDFDLEIEKFKGCQDQSKNNDPFVTDRRCNLLAEKTLKIDLQSLKLSDDNFVDGENHGRFVKVTLNASFRYDGSVDVFANSGNASEKIFLPSPRIC